MKKSRMLYGLYFIGIGILLLLSAYRLLGDISIWSILFGSLFGIMLVKSMMYRSWTGIFFNLAFLCCLFDEPLGITDLTPWTVLGVALCLSIGFHFLFGSKPKKAYRRKGEYEATMHFDDDHLWFDTNFAESMKYVASEHFQTANVRCTFGEMKVYFDQATIIDNATLHVEASFGTIELYVPKHWQIICSVRTMFGNYEEVGNHNATTPAPVLYIEGTVQFGNVKVVYI